MSQQEIFNKIVINCFVGRKFLVDLNASSFTYFFGDWMNGLIIKI